MTNDTWSQLFAPDTLSIDASRPQARVTDQLALFDPLNLWPDFFVLTMSYLVMT